MGSLSLLQGIFPTQGLNPDLPHCRQILYQLSHNRSPYEKIGNSKYMCSNIRKEVFSRTSQSDVPYLVSTHACLMC